MLSCWVHWWSSRGAILLLRDGLCRVDDVQHGHPDVGRHLLTGWVPCRGCRCAVLFLYDGLHGVSVLGWSVVGHLLTRWVPRQRCRGAVVHVQLGLHGDAVVDWGVVVWHLRIRKWILNGKGSHFRSIRPHAVHWNQPGR